MNILQYLAHCVYTGPLLRELGREFFGSKGIFVTDGEEWRTSRKVSHVQKKIVAALKIIILIQIASHMFSTNLLKVRFTLCVLILG